MNTHHVVKADERTLAVTYVANTRGLNFITFALLIDIIYRSLLLNEAAWDLFALIIISGAISMSYMARHKALVHVFSWKMIILMGSVALVSAVVAAILAMTKAM